MYREYYPKNKYLKIIGDHNKLPKITLLGGKIHMKNLVLVTNSATDVMCLYILLVIIISRGKNQDKGRLQCCNDIGVGNSFGDVGIPRTFS